MIFQRGRSTTKQTPSGYLNSLPWKPEFMENPNQIHNKWRFSSLGKSSISMGHGEDIWIFGPSFPSKSSRPAPVEKLREAAGPRKTLVTWQ